MDHGRAADALRIGELSRRLGVSEHVLRAWERRYGLLQPERTPGGYRLYSGADEKRVRRMQVHLAHGLSAAEAAHATLSEERAEPATADAAGEGLVRLARALAGSLDQFDEQGTQSVLDRLLGTFTVETVLREVVIPYLHELGKRWQRGEVSVAGEHFASNLLRGRLAAIARGWGNGRGPHAVLACAPGEQHDIGLLAFGIVLHQQGWRVEYLGADTPIADVARVVSRVRADTAVISAVTPRRFQGLATELSRLAQSLPLGVAGAGATAALAQAAGARLLTGDPVTEAERMPPSGHIGTHPQ